MKLAQTLALPAAELWTAGFAGLLLLSSLYGLGFYMLPATLPAYVKQIGASNFQTSLVIAAFATMSLFARIMSGAIIDVVGERRLILAGVTVIAVTTIAMIWLPVHGIVLLQTLRGIAWGFSSAAIATAIYKIVPEARRGEGSGYYALTTICAVSLTPIIAILLMDSLGYAAMLLASGLISFAALFNLNRALSTLPPRQQRGHRRISLRNVFERGAIVPALLSAILAVPFCGVLSFLVLFGNEQGISGIWTFFIGYTSMILVTRPFIGRLFDRQGHAIIIWPASVSMIIGLVLLSLAQSTTVLVVSSLFFGFGYGAIQPSLQTWAVNRCPADRKAAANGLFMSSVDVGFLFGALLLSYIAELSSFAMMYRYSALAVVAALALYLFDQLKARRLRGHAGD